MSSLLYREEHSDKVKESNRRYWELHRKEINEQRVLLRPLHREAEAVYKKEYRATHKEQISKGNAVYWSVYQPVHKDKLHEYRKGYYAINKDKELEGQRRWRLKNWERVSRRWRKHWAKRYRELGYVLLNQPFSGSEGHHVDKEQVINMPKVLHRSVYHRQDTGQGMAQMNAIAYNFLFKQEVEVAFAEVNHE